MIHTTQECRIGDNVELMREMPAESIDTIVTSPPYWGLRDYGVDGQIGLEPTLDEYHARMLEVTAECMRVLKPTGVMFWNHGDSYCSNWGGGRIGSWMSSKNEDEGRGWSGGEHNAFPPNMMRKSGIPVKSLTMQNERLIIKMIDDQGWILRNRVIWNKPNGMPSSVTDRFSNKYEPVYMLTKQRSYWFDLDAVRKPYTEPMNRWGGQKLKANGKSEWDKGTGQESYRDRDMRPNPLGKNPGDVWTIPTQPYPGSHFATFPTALIEPMIKAACPAEICPVCGLARERITDPSEEYAKLLGGGLTDHKDDIITGRKKRGECTTREHIPVGWTSCNCDAGWIAGTVLDPFAGSGTVLEVCRRLNLNALGLELNPNYEPLIRERSMSHTPPLTAY